MMYCEYCSHLAEENHCPVCGRRNLREVREKDPCFLTEQDFIRTGILEDVLRQNGIPFLKKSVLGAGLSIRVGPMLDRGRIYVAYDLLPRAQDLMDDLFSPDETEPQAE